jgi:Uma2 family endonuclease
MMTQPVALAPSTQERRLAMTYEEWLVWSDGESKQSEWVDGEVVVFMPPTILHARVSGFVFLLLSHYVRLRDLGQVLTAPVEMRLSPTVSHEPDLLVITPQRVDGPADLVVEIVSADSVRRDRLEKFAEYALAGVPEYWLLDPRPGHQREDFFRLTDEGIYEPIEPDAGGRVHSRALPGFWLDPAWLRQDPLPDPVACLREIAPDLLAGGPLQAGA